MRERATERAAARSAEHPDNPAVMTTPGCLFCLQRAAAGLSLLLALAPTAVPAAQPATMPTPAPAAASGAGHGVPLQPARPKKPPPPVYKLVDINSASRKDLKTLPGIGDAEADRIIACRPFLTKADLVTKKVLPAGPFLTLKDRVVAVQKSRPKAASAAAGTACG